MPRKNSNARQRIIPKRLKAKPDKVHIVPVKEDEKLVMQATTEEYLEALIHVYMPYNTFRPDGDVRLGRIAAIGHYEEVNKGVAR